MKARQSSSKWKVRFTTKVQLGGLNWPAQPGKSLSTNPKTAKGAGLCIVASRSLCIVRWVHPRPSRFLEAPRRFRPPLWRFLCVTLCPLWLKVLCVDQKKSQRLTTEDTELHRGIATEDISFQTESLPDNRVSCRFQTCTRIIAAEFEQEDFRLCA